MSIKDLLSFFTRQQSSKDVAKERLRLVLVHDRSSVSSEFIDKIKVEIIEVISKYMDIDEEATKIDIQDSDGTAILEANLVIKNIKRGSKST